MGLRIPSDITAPYPYFLPHLKAKDFEATSFVTSFTQGLIGSEKDHIIVGSNLTVNDATTYSGSRSTLGENAVFDDELCIGEDDEGSKYAYFFAYERTPSP